ncbi:MAG: hypothetical protein ISR57_01370 [Bacteroidales bacterium]|nr:hypothetical protein [Bacteroidota bacterium]MBL6949270.1 hypothetical protein [Bacteroidales bacterium]
MKRFILLLGVIMILPVYSVCQDTSYLSTDQFEAEKKRIRRSVYRIKKANQELQKQLSIQHGLIDSLSEVIHDQRNQITEHQDSLVQLQSYQATLDGRLDTQKKSGTMLVILIPAGLFLLFLILLIWLLMLRHRTRINQEQLEEKIKKGTKRFDDLIASNAKEQSAMKTQISSSFSELEKRFDTFSKEMEIKVQKLEQFQREEKIAHETLHKEAQTEVEKFKSELQKGYSAITKELGNLKEESAAIIKQTKDYLMEMIKKKPKE